MRGFEYVGRVTSLGWGYEIGIGPDPIDTVSPGDVLCVSAYEHGPMRSGFVQVDVVGEDLVVTRASVRDAIPTIAERDYVFRATALGELAFRRPS